MTSSRTQIVDRKDPRQTIELPDLISPRRAEPSFQKKKVNWYAIQSALHERRLFRSHVFVKERETATALKLHSTVRAPPICIPAPSQRRLDRENLLERSEETFGGLVWRPASLLTARGETGLP